jgi:flagellar L-ring protein precursor FlgH
MRVWIVLLILCSVVPAHAGSLWPGNGTSMFTDHRAAGVGDLVTVVVSESIASQTQAKTSETQTISIDMAGGSGLLSLLPSGGFQSGHGSTANRAVGSGIALQARITLRVAQVLPGGVLRLEGVRELLVRGEPYTLRVSGLVRRLDIQADNTVSSDRLSDARIVLEAPRKPNPSGNPLQWLLDGFGALVRLLFSWIP